ncbi:MAG: acyl carrier protein [Burkholderiaceae bacterium]
MPSTFERLRSILVRDYKVDGDAVTPESSLESLHIDSLGATELLFTIEDEFDIRLTKEPANLATVADVVGFIDALLARSRQPSPDQADPGPQTTET